MLDRPALPACDRLLDPGQIVLHVEILLGRHLRQADAEVLLELDLEREVGLDVVPGPSELEALPHAGPVEPNRDQDERRTALGAAAVGLVPAEHPEGEIEDVDPLFLDREAGLTEGRAQAQIERGAGKRGLELVVGVALGGSAGVFVGLAQHGQQLGGDVVEIVRGRFGGRHGRRLGGAGEEVHDPRAAGRGSAGRGPAHEDPEELARPLIHNLDAAPLRGTEIEQRVPEREIEDVAAGFLELLPDGGEVGHGRKAVLRGDPVGGTGGCIGRCPAFFAGVVRRGTGRRVRGSGLGAQGCGRLGSPCAVVAGCPPASSATCCMQGLPGHPQLS